MANEAEAKLTKLLEKIFEDDVVDVAERSALLEFQADGELDARGIEKVFSAFVEARWGAAMADGVLTMHEKLALRRILEELELRDERIPLQLRLALKST